MEGYDQLSNALDRLLAMDYDGSQGDAPFSGIKGSFGEVLESFQARQLADLVNRVADASEGKAEMPGGSST